MMESGREFLQAFQGDGMLIRRSLAAPNAGEGCLPTDEEVC